MSYYLHSASVKYAHIGLGSSGEDSLLSNAISRYMVETGGGFGENIRSFFLNKVCSALSQYRGFKSDLLSSGGVARWRDGPGH